MSPLDNIYNLKKSYLKGFNLFFKLILFPIVLWLFSNYSLLLFFPLQVIVGVTLFFTFIGVITEPIILPLAGNLAASAMGAFFMGLMIYFIPLIAGIGFTTLLGALLAGFSLGVIEYILHYRLIIPTLK